MRKNLKQFAALVAVSVVGVGGVTMANAAVSNATPGSVGVSVNVSGDTYNPLTPARILDTRKTAAVAPGKAYALSVTTGVNAVPAAATAVVLGVTVAGSTSNGDITVDPAGVAETGTSDVNFGPGQLIMSEVTVRVGTGGAVDLWNNSTGSTQLVVDLKGYYTAPVATSSVTYTPTTATATSTLVDHPDSGNGGNWAVDSITRTASVTLKGAAPVSNCGGAATTCYLYEGSIHDTGTFTTASSNDVSTDGLSPNAGKSINGTETGDITGGSAVEFYASSNAPSNLGVAAVVSGAVSGEQTTGNWVEQFFPAGTTFGAGPNLLNWNWTYSTSNTCETWVDAYNGETGDITGVNACPSN